jgi:heme exporter protein A
MSMIEVYDLTKSFGPRAALADVSFTVAAGESAALVGPNGAGKTTLLRILATLSQPTSGTVYVVGMSLARAAGRARRYIGFLSHRTLLYEDLTAEQNLRFYACMYDLVDGPARIEELLERVGLIERRHDLVRTFSRGMQQRLAVARAVLHRPRALLLDEPYTGLDPDAARVLTDLLAELAGEGRTVLWTTHNLERGLASDGRMIVLARGRIVHDEEQGVIDPATFPEIYRALTAI